MIGINFQSEVENKMNGKILLKLQEWHLLLWSMPSFAILFGVNSFALILRLMKKIPSGETTWIDYIELGVAMVFITELYLMKRKPTKIKRKKIQGHAATCTNKNTCKCTGEY